MSTNLNNFWVDKNGNAIPLKNAHNKTRALEITANGVGAWACSSGWVQVDAFAHPLPRTPFFQYDVKEGWKADG